MHLSFFARGRPQLHGPSRAACSCEYLPSQSYSVEKRRKLHLTFSLSAAAADHSSKIHFDWRVFRGKKHQ